MNYIQRHSSIVIIGDSFTVGAFNVGKHERILGELDATRSITLPVLGNYSFKDSPFHVLIEPQKIQIDYKNENILPNDLLNIALEASTAISSSSPQGIIKAIGINLNVVISPEELGIDGVDYCANHFIADRKRWIDVLSPDDDFSSAGRLSFNRDGVMYTMRFEPHYKSDQKNLFVDINAHQDVEPPLTFSGALKNYDSIKVNILNIFENALAAH